MTELPSHARVVIVGGGIVGCSVAYHLALRGVTDVVLLERRQLTCGTTWHAAGLVGQLRATHNLTRLAQYTTNLFATLESETGQATGFRACGSVSVAPTEARFEELKRGASMARVFGLEVNIISPADVQDLFPLARVDDLVGGVHLPGDGVTNPIDTTQALAKGARARGVRIVENVKVERILTEHGRAVGVVTEFGEIRADAVVNAAGMWAHRIGDQVGAVVPLHAAEHFYIVTEGIDGLSPQMPVLRDQDGCGYFKEEAGKLMVGWFEPVAKPWGMTKPGGGGGIPESFCFDSLPEDFEHIAPLVEAATHRMPLLASTGIRLVLQRSRGLHSRRPLPARRVTRCEGSVHGVWVQLDRHPVVGWCRQGVGRLDHRRPCTDGPVGRRHPARDAFPAQRQLPARSNGRSARAAVRDALAVPATRDSAWCAPLRAARSVERRRCMLRRGRRLGTGQLVRAGGRRARVRVQLRKAELVHLLRRRARTRCARAVGLFDLSSFGKFVLEGPDAESVLNRICANDVAVPVGKIVYTQWLNERGGIEADLTVTREAVDRYLIVTAAATQVRDFAYLRDHIPPGAHAIATDVTSGQAVLSIMGPHSQSTAAVDDDG